MKTSMNKRSHQCRSSSLVARPASRPSPSAFACGTGACELVTDFDRSLIPDAGSDDASDLDVQIPPFDFDAGDAGDALALRSTRAATRATRRSTARPMPAMPRAVDASDAADAADAADGGDALRRRRTRVRAGADYDDVAARCFATTSASAGSSTGRFARRASTSGSVPSW